MEPHPGRRLLSPVETGGGIVHLEQHDIEPQQEVQQAATDSREGTVGDQSTSTSVSRVASETSLSDETVDVDMEMDLAGASARRKCNMTAGQLLRPISEVCPALVDLSNYLNRTPDTSDDDSDTNMIDTQVYHHVTEAPDVYGWNDEWNRMHVTSHVDPFTPRNRVGRKAAKVSLLQRVLSVGRATAVGRRAGFSG